MQQQGELRSDIDYLIDILRSNPKTKFTHTKLHTLTGYPLSFIKKWISVLEEQGHIQFFYNISNEEFAWVSDNSQKQHRNDKEITVLEKENDIETKKELKTYEKHEIEQLLNDIKNSIDEAKKISAGIQRLKKLKSTDLATVGIAMHNLERTQEKLAHLLSEAKRLRN